MKRSFASIFACGLLSAAIAGCTSGGGLYQQPTVSETTATHSELLALPAPTQPVSVAVYGYFDQTGQYKFSDTVQTLSRAVTQGGTSILIKALQDAGGGSWFKVVERERLENLLKERQIIRETRAKYSGNGDLNKNYLPPMMFAGVLLEGGIISYNTNNLTGGVGARYLGIGGSVQYRQDTVTVYLRAISTNSGEVLKSVLARKTIMSVGLDLNVFKFVGAEELLELEAGFTTNEPIQVALKQAIEKAVISMVMEGANGEIWDFQDAALGRELVNQYMAEKRAEEYMTAAEFARLKEQKDLEAKLESQRRDGDPYVAPVSDDVSTSGAGTSDGTAEQAATAPQEQAPAAEEAVQQSSAPEADSQSVASSRSAAPQAAAATAATTAVPAATATPAMPAVPLAAVTAAPVTNAPVSNTPSTNSATTTTSSTAVPTNTSASTAAPIAASTAGTPTTGTPVESISTGTAPAAVASTATPAMSLPPHELGKGTYVATARYVTARAQPASTASSAASVVAAPEKPLQLVPVSSAKGVVSAPVSGSSAASAPFGNVTLANAQTVSRADNPSTSAGPAEGKQSRFRMAVSRIDGSVSSN